MEAIRLITKDTDLKQVLHELSWDVDIAGVKYKAFFAYGVDPETGDFINYNHSLGSNNDYTWCCPRDEEPSFENLIAFNGEPCRWDFQVHVSNAVKSKWDRTKVEKRITVDIMRNGEVFNTIGCRDMFYGVAKAQLLIEEYREHPLPLNEYDFEHKIIGRKIRYNGVPGEIVRWCRGCVAVRPLPGADINRFFANPHNIDDEYIEDRFEEDKINNEIIVDLMSQDIWWFEN
jgi:hypothetical protein